MNNNIHTKTRCKGSEKVGKHNLILVKKNSSIQLCDNPDCDILYYNVETGKWTYKPVLETERLKHN